MSGGHAPSLAHDPGWDRSAGRFALGLGLRPTDVV